MREIKFRAWDKVLEKWFYWELTEPFSPFTWDYIVKGLGELDDKTIGQFTGLKDKNGLKEVYEGDIIDLDGNLKGNVYENKAEKTDFVIEGFATKTWLTTYKKAMDRGCKDSE